MAIITISRQYGSGGDEIALKLHEKLGYRYFDRSLMIRVASEMGLLEKEVVDFSEDSYEVQDFLKRALGIKNIIGEIGTWTEDTTGRKMKVVEKIDEEQGITLVKNIVQGIYRQDNVVIVGRGGQAILQDMPGVLHVHIVAPVESRIQRIQEQENVTQEEAKKMVEKRDRASTAYLKRFYKLDWSDATLYHLVINTGKWDLEAAVDFIANAVGRLAPVASSA